MNQILLTQSPSVLVDAPVFDRGRAYPLALRCRADAARSWSTLIEERLSDGQPISLGSADVIHRMTDAMAAEARELAELSEQLSREIGGLAPSGGEG
jgi:hypothetical protein